MKTNKIIYLLLSFIIISLISSCEMFIKKDIPPVSEISTYPIFVLEGGETVVHKIGTPWSEPGVLVSEVKEGDNDLASTLKIDDSEIDVNVRGLYTIKYTATNKYGYTKTKNRYVLVTSDVTDLYPIAGSYYQGFFPNDFNQMTVSEGDVKGFWKVGNIRNLSKPVEGYIADLGDKTYIVALAFSQRKISNLKYVYLSGTAVLDDSGSKNKLIFTISEVYDDNTPLSDPQVYTWVFNGTK